MPDPTIIYPGLVGDVNMNPGLPMVGASMGPNLISPVLPGVAFSTRGLGKFPVSKLTGRQGAIDMWVTLGATGSLRSLLVLTDGDAVVTIHLGTDNRINLTHQSQTHVLVADLTNGFAADVAGSRFRLRYTWDSTQPVDGPKYAMLRKNEEKGNVLSGSAWTSFYPTEVWLGVAIGVTLDFNGTIDKVQIGSSVVTT